MLLSTTLTQKVSMSHVAGASIAQGHSRQKCLRSRKAASFGSLASRSRCAATPPAPSQLPDRTTVSATQAYANAKYLF